MLRLLNKTGRDKEIITSRLAGYCLEDLVLEKASSRGNHRFECLLWSTQTHLASKCDPLAPQVPVEWIRSGGIRYVYVVQEEANSFAGGK